MNDLKTIVVAWADTRPGHYGELLAALWGAEGTDADLNTALAYAHKEHATVHTFATDDDDWKVKALVAHGHGGL
jgi:hypothetical protein